MPNLILTAPLSGWLTRLDDVPDAAFAERMVGEGAAIDPTDSMLCAPCDGVITMIAEASHALTLRAESGAEILLHVGIDTVGLGGDGLARQVEPGSRVRRGDPLLAIDLDLLARRAKSLVTPVVVTNAGQFPVKVGKTDCLVAVGEPFLEIDSAAGTTQSAARPGSEVPDAAGAVTVRLEHGFHARPAAHLARCSRKFHSRIVMSAHGRLADAGSTVALMALGVGFGDRVEIRAYGADANDALRALCAEIAAGLGETPVQVLAPVELPPAANSGRGPTRPREIHGRVASRGLAIGIAHQFAQPHFEVPEAGAGAAFERVELDKALDAVRCRLAALAAASGSGSASDILNAHCEFLGDPGLLDAAANAIHNGKSAGFAWQSALGTARDLLRQTGDARLTERIADLSDVEAQVLQELHGEADAFPAELPESAIVLASELLPSQFSGLDLSKVVGLCSAAGGPTSHVALLAAAMGIPAVVGAGRAVLEIASGTGVLLDAETGTLRIEPDEEEIARARGNITDRRERRARFLETAKEDCYTADGQRIEIFANLASVTEAGNAVECGAEGCGLLRTEFLFQERTAAPTEESQAVEYQAIADALAPRPLVIRLLDAGGDKPIPYLPLPREENPLLGLRGLRALFRFPDLLRTQLAAILRVETASGCRILLPMITEPGEIQKVREIIDELSRQRKMTGAIAVGAMIETPASVALAHAISRGSDFLSIGTNDLAQYTLAMDRAHPELAGAFEYFHPAVLHQVAAVCDAAESAGRSVSVCGALASDLEAAPVLIGLGVRTLSAVPNMIPELKALVRTLSLSACRDLARAALALDDAVALRRLANDFPSREQSR